MTVKWVTHPNGKGRIQVGELNAREWMEWLERTNANGVAKITSINHRAAQHQSRQQAQDGEDPTGQGRRQP
jgi:hypothetical protein